MASFGVGWVRRCGQQSHAILSEFCLSLRKILFLRKILLVQNQPLLALVAFVGRFRDHMRHAQGIVGGVSCVGGLAVFCPGWGVFCCQGASPR